MCIRDRYCPGGTVPPEEQDAALDAASRDIDGLTFDPVSYTHLDVYKRQVERLAAGWLT